MSAARWYCIHTKPRAEQQAFEHLQRQAFECFLPRIARTVIKAGRRQSVVEPLFPRYLFLRANTAHQSLAPIRSTRGALGVVRFANQPGEVPQDLIERLQHDAGHEGVITVPETTPKRGDTVTVLTGVFAGLRGLYAELCGQHRAIVLLQLLGGTQRVVLPLDELHIAQPA